MNYSVLKRKIEALQRDGISKEFPKNIWNTAITIIKRRKLLSKVCFIRQLMANITEINEMTTLFDQKHTAQYNHRT